MPWEPGVGAGFTAGDPWLPIGPDSDRRNVSSERSDPGSLLGLYRELLALRRRTPALQAGTYRSLESPAGVLAYERRAPAGYARVALNLSDEPRRIDLGPGRVREWLFTAPDRQLPGDGPVELGASEGLVAIFDEADRV